MIGGATSQAPRGPIFHWKITYVEIHVATGPRAPNPCVSSCSYIPRYVRCHYIQLCRVW